MFVTNAIENKREKQYYNGLLVELLFQLNRKFLHPSLVHWKMNNQELSL